MRKLWRQSILLAAVLMAALMAYAQQDTAQPQKLDSFILRQRGLFGDLVKNLLSNNPIEAQRTVQRNDIAFQRYRGRTIRNILVQSLDFGVPIADTGKRFANTITRLLDQAHKSTRERVVRKNLFFKEGSVLSPFMLGATERHLRDLSYLQEARIVVIPVREDPNAVDVIVFLKDAFSLGGGINVHQINRVEVKLQEDNFMGRGDRIQASGFYDSRRKKNLGYGGEYRWRNIEGSFIDAHIGFQTYGRSFSSYKFEERTNYLKVIKPLVNPYMKWTYALELSSRSSVNMYHTDSMYKSDYAYGYTLGDAWVGWNITADKPSINNVEDRLNLLVSSRFIQRHFDKRPSIAGGRYFYRYTDFEAVLGALSLYRQTFYKTSFIYGFGRNEDVPEGVDASIIGGLTNTAGRRRPYLGIDLQRFYFTRQDHYLSYTLRAGSYFFRSGMEDISVLGNIDYFSRLHLLNDRWKQRSFISASFGKQINYRLTEPLFVESHYGLTGYKNDNLAGDTRITLKAESVFFSPWMLAYFRLAPFGFATGSLFRASGEPVHKHKLYSSVGGGLRIQNESLVFGTIEIKGAYFPNPDFEGRGWRVEIGTNIRFRYNKEFIKRPELVGVN
ncbi:MAG: hypothetical protein JWP69_329 [Flaviaesturariibacter sp.]|nr:hypothetical protein [Flaviaesturariibacter sp.]